MGIRKAKAGLLSLIFAASAVLPAQAVMAVPPPVKAVPPPLPAAWSTPAAPAIMEIFGREVFSKPLKDSPIARRWDDLLQRNDDEGYAACLPQWGSIVGAVNRLLLPTQEQLADIVNEKINAATIWMSDDLLYHTSDYFATPAETCGKSHGDCEDFAILKYFMLRQLGVPKEHLFITFVDSNPQYGEPNIDHAVLVMNVATNDAPRFVILDNRARTLTDMKDSKYVFYGAMNEDGRWKLPDSPPRPTWGGHRVS